MNKEKFNAIKAIVFSKKKEIVKTKPSNDWDFEIPETQNPPANTILSDLEYKLACMLFNEVKGCTNETEYTDFKEAIKWLSTSFIESLAKRYYNGYPCHEGELYDCHNQLSLDNIFLASSQLLEAYAGGGLALRDKIPIPEVLEGSNANVLLALVQLNFSMNNDSIITAVEVLYMATPKKSIEFIRAIPNKQQNCTTAKKEAKNEAYLIMAEKYYEFLSISESEANAKDKVSAYMEKMGIYGKVKATKKNRKPSRKTVGRAIAAYPQ